MLETGNEKNQDKIIEYSAIANDFLEKLYFTIEDLKDNNLLKVAKEMSAIVENTKLNPDEINIIKNKTIEYPEYFFTSAIFSIENCIFKDRLVDKFEDIHINLIEHLSNMINVQIMLKQQEKMD